MFKFPNWNVFNVSSKIPSDWHPLNKESLRGFRSARPIPHHYRMTKQISPSQLLPPVSGHLPSPPRRWPGSFQFGDPEEKLIFAFNRCLPWFQADGSTDKRHGEQGKAGTRAERQETLVYALCDSLSHAQAARGRSCMMWMQRGQTPEPACWRKGLEKHTGTDSLRDKHRDWQSGSCSWKALTLWIKTTEKGTCKVTVGISNPQCWRKQTGAELRIWHAGMKLVLPLQKALNKVFWWTRRVWTLCEKVSEKADKSQGMEYATGGHSEAQKSKRQLQQVPQSNERMTRWTWEGLWHEGVKQELTEQEQKGQGQQRSEDCTVRKELTVGKR